MQVIDALVLELGLDATRFTQGQREAMDSLRRFEEQSVRSGRQVEAQGRQVMEAFSALKREALGVIGLFLGGRGIKEFVSYVTDLDLATSRVAKTMDVASSELSAWQGALKQSGGTAEGATAALAGLSGEMTRFQLTGQSQMLPVLSRLGISLFDQNRNLKSSTQLWLELADAVQQMDPRQAAAFLAMIPGANQEMINFALLGRRAMEEYLDAAKRAGTTTEESARAAVEYQRAIQELDQSATGLGRTLVTAVAPAIATVMNSLRDLLQSWRGVTGSPEAAAQGARTRLQTMDKLGDPRTFMEWMRDHLSMGEEDRGRWDRIITRLYGAGTGRQGAEQELADALGRKQGAAAAPGNWANFLSGLSYLETSQRGGGNASSTAQGFFQFLSGTRDRAIRAGLPDPGVGDYAAQAGATRQYIQRFYPAAAKAIEAGDFPAAERMLKGEWPSLPGGSQPQSAARYQTFSQELTGGGPRPPGAAMAPGIAAAPPSAGNTTSVTATIGQVNVHTRATDAEGIARDIEPALRRSLTAGAANYGQQ